METDLDLHHETGREDQVLSEIHMMELRDTLSVLDNSPTCSTIYQSVYSFSLIPKLVHPVDIEIEDLMELPNVSTKVFDIYLWHAMETSLSDVGSQLWAASFLLCDYILWKRSVFKEALVIELGCGLGLPSIISSLCMPSLVLASDSNERALKMLSSNLLENQALLCDDKIIPCKANWADFGHFSEQMHTPVTELCSGLKLCPSLSSFMCHITNCTSHMRSIIMASDVAVSPSATDSFIASLHVLLTVLSADLCIFSLQKRLNFMLDEGTVSCQEYQYFLACIEELIACNFPEYSVSTLDADDVPRYSCLDRDNYLELIIVTKCR